MAAQFFTCFWSSLYFKNKKGTEFPFPFLFKAKNNLEEILLDTQLKLQKTKNELIKNLEKDFEKAIELVCDVTTPTPVLTLPV